MLDPARPHSLNCIQHPTEERVGLLGGANASHREHRERCIADPRVAIVPVPHAPDWCGQRRRGGRQRFGTAARVIEQTAEQGF
jgi:hypothetical protein